jgi:glycosyltransferase involved in cell wall biosynthesis
MILDNNKTQLTIGIPTKNRATMLSELLNDIANYNSDLPIVISDNSDRDDTAQVVNRYTSRLKIKYIYNQQQFSQAENFNLVLKNSSTKYVMLMHDDDRLLPTSLATYLSLVDYLEKNAIAVFGVYVSAFKFKNEEDLGKLIALPSLIPSSLEIEENLRIFNKEEYQKYFVEKGIGGKAPGVLVNRFLMEANNINFPTNAGAKHDKAFFLTANAIGCVGSWKKELIAKRLHQNSSIHRKVTENYCLFNQKVIEIYKDDLSSIQKIHKKRFENWMRDEPRFKPIECYRLLLSSQLSFWDIISLFSKYFYHHLIVKGLFGQLITSN